MGKLYYILAVVLLGTSISGYAQSQTTWKTNIDVNGVLDEWGDSLMYYFDKQDIQYTIANDDEFLYIVCRIRDKQQQVQASLHGLSVTINTDAKKKDGPRLIFPVPDKSAWKALTTSESDEKDARKLAMQSIRALFVQDFDEILNGPISLRNTFGIRAAVHIDSTDALCYEAAISLNKLKLTAETDFAFNLKINQTTTHTYYSRDRGRRYPYGYGYGYGNRMRRSTAVREEPGVWLLLHLTDNKQP